MKKRNSCNLSRYKGFAGLSAALLISVFYLASCSYNMQEQKISVKHEKNDLEGQMHAEASETAAQPAVPVSLINADGGTVRDRIKAPEGFVHTEAEADSFGQYLRMLPLKPHGSQVRLYDGSVKSSDSHAAVLDVDVGDRDLQQCADAVIRLRAEYLYGRKLYDKIHFNFTNGFNADFSTWIKGKSIKVSGNNARWVDSSSSTADYESFRRYLNMVFAYAGTLSLSKELTKTPLEEIQPGDVFIKGASPGHAAIVLDTAENEKTGQKVFLLAQSYMPAQDIHILKNPGKEELSPWYSTDFGDELYTPDWVFEKDQLMRFEN